MSVYSDSINAQLPREYDGQVDFLMPQNGLTSYPVRPFRELRIPLPPREADVADVPFEATEVQPQYAISYIDEAVYQEKLRDGSLSKYIADQQIRWYKKLGILTSHERAVNDEINRLRELRDELPDDSFMKGTFVV